MKEFFLRSFTPAFLQFFLEKPVSFITYFDRGLENVMPIRPLKMPTMSHFKTGTNPTALTDGSNRTRR
jgi:hypothetical protein